MRKFADSIVEIKSIRRPCSNYNIRKNREKSAEAKLASELGQKFPSRKIVKHSPKGLLESNILLFLELIQKKLMMENSKCIDRESLLNNEIKNHLNVVQESILNNYIAEKALVDESLYKSPDVKIRKYTLILRKSATYNKLPNICIEELAKKTGFCKNNYDSEMNLPNKTINISPIKERIKRPLRKQYNKLNSKVKKAMEINNELNIIKDKYNDVKTKWDICGKYLREVKKVNKNKEKGNSRVDFYIWQSIVKRKTKI